MEINTRGTRTILATVAAGTLVLGTAGAVSAAGSPQGPKDGNVKVTKVDIKRHKKINLTDPYGDLKLRVKVRDTAMAADGEVTGLSVALFTSKRAADAMVEGTEIAAAADGMRAKGKWTTYKFTVAKDALAGLDEAVDAPFKGYLCISGIETDIEKFSRQTARRLDDVESTRTLRECVKVVDRTDEVEDDGEAAPEA